MRSSREAMAQVKGTAVVASARYIRERFSQSSLDRVLRALPEGDRSAFDAGILASAWYPMDLLLRFMQEAERQLAGTEPELIRNMGAASADYGLTTVYRIFFKVGSPEFIISRAAGVFSKYYDTGKLSVDSRPGRTVVELSDLQGTASQFCARIHGWMARILELTGAKNPRSAHSLCVHRGDPVCRWEGTWDS
jgi:hypothetical protein